MSLHDAVLDYCLGVVEQAGGELRNRRLAFWGTLALMRCVGSSPAAAVSALRNRLAADPDRLEEQVFDDDGDESDAVDVEPATVVEHADEALVNLIEQAELLVSASDPKLTALIALLRPLLADGANPVVFCRFIATAMHVADGLRRAFPKLKIDAVTGALTADERRARVDAMGEAEQRLLVATDCLSEGINLQEFFDSVFHYDLSWNPTRHQQREGRVGRFGQRARLVRSALLYSPDSAIDGAVLDVILRKAKAIRDATGVTVPLPEERGAVTGALMNAVLLRKKAHSHRQLAFDFGADVAAMETRWRDAEEGEKRSRARFAQNAMKPEEVAPEWRRWRNLLGSPSEVQRFVTRAMARFNAPLEGANGVFKAHLAHLPNALVERLSARGLDGTIRIAFDEPPPAGGEVAARSHPLPSVLAEALLEGALDRAAQDKLGRAGAWPTSAVRSLTMLALLRLRFKLTVHGRRERLLLVEEANAVSFGPDGAMIAAGQEARALLEGPATHDLAPPARARLLADALRRILAQSGVIGEFAHARAETLAQDHARVRTMAANVPRVSVEPVLPADIIGLFVLVPVGG